MRRILNALGSYVMYCLFSVGGKSKTDSGAERRSALEGYNGSHISQDLVKEVFLEKLS